MVFRKLALKSVFNFGKLYDHTVIQALCLNRHRYLIWVYYNCSHIDFLDEILEVLDITEDRRIKKPGCDRNYHEEHKNEFNPDYDDFQSKLRIRTSKYFKKRNQVQSYLIERGQNKASRNRDKNLKRYKY
ncbi:hypothetical protein KAR91_70620 [Candidatus Pacearchaeota archaeon]|nr:hypothetical protein [Candidatus Pacearchaeota archaeon]